MNSVTTWTIEADRLAAPPAPRGEATAVEGLTDPRADPNGWLGAIAEGLASVPEVWAPAEGTGARAAGEPVGIAPLANTNRLETSRRVLATAAYDAWVVTWWPGQVTAHHVHDGAGAMVVTEGQLVETIASDDPGGEESVRVLTRDEGVRFEGTLAHRLANLDDRVAVSIHVYAPPLGTL